MFIYTITKHWKVSYGVHGKGAIWQVHYFLWCEGLFVYKYVTSS